MTDGRVTLTTDQELLLEYKVTPQHVQQVLDIISTITPDTVVSDTTDINIDPGQLSAGYQFTLVQEGSSIYNISNGDLAGDMVYHLTVDPGSTGNPDTVYGLEVDGNSATDNLTRIPDAISEHSDECPSPSIDARDEVKDNSCLNETAGSSFMEMDTTLSSSPEGKARDHKGRFKRKVSGSAKQQLTREKDRKRKEMGQKLAIFNKFAKYIMQEEDFEFFAMFKSKGETHFAGTHQLQKRFKDNLNLIDFQDSMIETRVDSVVRKLHLQKAKKAAVEPSPSKASEHMSFLPGLGLAASQKAELEAGPSFNENSIAIETGNVEQLKKRIFVRKHRKPVKSRIEEMEETSAKGKGKGKGRVKGNRS